ncbi:MAG: archease, partial [Deltaproteobacteria bacterium]|nr:archease [Deltaproteobacteria bacterium]
FDAEIHTMKTEIKAVTYHQLEVVEDDQGWQAQVIFDI